MIQDIECNLSFWILRYADWLVTPFSEPFDLLIKGCTPQSEQGSEDQRMYMWKVEQPFDSDKKTPTWANSLI